MTERSAAGNIALIMPAAFVDPRTQPKPPWTGARRPPAERVADVEPLITALREGRIYAVESWIAEGKPIQFTYSSDRRRSPTSPLQAAIWSAGHDAVLLLLCNGYRLDLERRSPLTEAFKAHSLDVVRLLLAWGADPHDVDVNQVVSCYDAALVEEFWRRGIDFGDDNALAGALAHMTSNRPLYGFMKQHASEDRTLQRELDRGLCFALDRSRYGYEDGDSVEKAVHLCMWAGADPWHAVPAENEEDAADEWSAYDCAAGRAVVNGQAELLPALKLNADAPHFYELYGLLRDAATFTALARIAPPKNLPDLVHHALSDLALSRSLGGSGSTSMLRSLLDAGGRLEYIHDLTLRRVRDVLRGPGSYLGGEIVQLLQKPDHAAPAVFLRIIATPPILARRRDLRITQSSLRALADLATASEAARRAARLALKGD